MFYSWKVEVGGRLDLQTLKVFEWKKKISRKRIIIFLVILLLCCRYLYHLSQKMKPNILIGGLDKMATDFTANSVMMATSKYVKNGPVPIPVPGDDSNSPSKSNTITRKPYRSNSQHQLEMQKKNIKQQKQQSKSKKKQYEMPNRLDQLGRGPLFQGMDVPRPARNTKPTQHVNQSDLDKKQHKFNRSKRQLKSSSKSKEKSFSRGEKQRTNEKKKSPNMIEDRRNIVHDSQSSYSKINSARNTEKRRVFTKTESKTESDLKKDIQSPAPEKGKRFERNTDKQKQQTQPNKRVIMRKSQGKQSQIQPPQEKRIQNPQRTRQEKIKQQNSINKEDKRQANKLKQVEEKRKIAPSREERLERNSLERQKKNEMQQNVRRAEQKNTLSQEQSGKLMNRYGRKPEVSQDVQPLNKPQERRQIKRNSNEVFLDQPKTSRTEKQVNERNLPRKVQSSGNHPQPKKISQQNPSNRRKENQIQQKNNRTENENKRRGYQRSNLKGDQRIVNTPVTNIPREKQIQNQSQSLRVYDRQNSQRQMIQKPVQQVTPSNQRAQQQKPEAKPTRYGQRAQQRQQETKPHSKPETTPSRYGQRAEERQAETKLESTPARYGQRVEEKQPEVKSARYGQRVQEKQQEIKPARYGQRVQDRQTQIKPEPKPRYGQRAEERQPEIKPSRPENRVQEKQPEIKSARPQRVETKPQTKIAQQSARYDPKELDKKPESNITTTTKPLNRTQSQHQPRSRNQKNQPQNHPKHQTQHQNSSNVQQKNQNQVSAKGQDGSEKIRSNIIIFKLNHIFKQTKQQNFSFLKSQSDEIGENRHFQSIFFKKLFQISETIDSSIITSSFKRLKVSNDSQLASQIKTSMPAHISEQSLSILVTCLTAFEKQSKLCFFDRMKAKKESSIGYSLDCLYKEKIKQAFNSLKVNSRKKEFVRQFYIHQMGSIANSSNRFNQGRLFSQIMISSTDQNIEKIQQYQEPEPQKPQIPQKPSQASRVQQQKLLRQESQLKKLRTAYVKQKNTLQAEIQELKQVTKEMKFQVEARQQEHTSLKDKFDNMDLNEGEQTDMFEHQTTKLPLLLEIYKSVKKSDPGSMISMNAYDGMVGSSQLVKQWGLILENSRLKGLIDIYEDTLEREKRAVLEIKTEGEVIEDFLRSYIQEKYLWEWARKCIAS